jgi:uncharacterized damage-inducible protein DinB
MNESADLLARYRDGVVQVRDAFAGLSREQLLARPVPGKWSSMEVLCHLVDTDLRTAERIRTALIADLPRIPGVPIEQLTTLVAVDARDAAEEIEFFRMIRQQTFRILAGLPATALERGAVLVKPDGSEARKTIAQLVSGITAHAVHHLGFVPEKRRLLGCAM